MPTPTTAPARQAGFINVVRVISGNFLEMYDFMVFGYYASAIAATIFPAGTPFASLMLTMMTFGAGFLMRPLGALVLAGRLLQGFSAGVELGGVSVYLAEIAPAGRKGLYISWQSASQQLAVIFAALGFVE